MRRFSSIDRSAARPISAALMAVRASVCQLPLWDVVEELGLDCDVRWFGSGQVAFA